MLPNELESPDMVPKPNGELVLPLFWPKLRTRPPKNEFSFGRGVAISTTLVGLSSILTSSSSLGGVTGRGKLPNNDFCGSTALELVPKVKTPELEVPWEGSPNCGAVGFSGEVGGAPNLKVNEKPGFVSFDASLCVTVGGLVGSPGDRVGFGCSGVNAFGPSVEFEAPNPAKGVSDELPNGSTESVGSFCSEPTTVGLCSVAEIETFVSSGALLWVGGPPNRLDGGWVLVGGVGAVNGVFSGTPSNGAGVGSGT